MTPQETYDRILKITDPETRTYNSKQPILSMSDNGQIIIEPEFYNHLSSDKREVVMDLVRRSKAD